MESNVKQLLWILFILGILGYIYYTNSKENYEDYQRPYVKIENVIPVKQENRDSYIIYGANDYSEPYLVYNENKNEKDNEDNLVYKDIKCNKFNYEYI